MRTLLAPRPKRQLSISCTVRTLLDFFTTIPGSSAVQIEVTKENVGWAKAEKRIFLKQNLETRLVALCVLLSTPGRKLELTR